MSTIGGKKREVKADLFPKYVGFFKAEVVKINPSRQELNKLLGKDDEENDKEIEYTGEKEGVDWARIKFWLSVEGEDDLYLPYDITIKNEVRRSKDKTKIQLINQVGDSQWIEADEDGNFDEATLFNSFTHFVNVLDWVTPTGDIEAKWKKGYKANNVEILGEKKYRPALIGEEELCNFIKTWLPMIDLKSPEGNVLLDTDKLFKDNFKDLTSLIGDEDFSRPFVSLAYVNVDADDETKQYQKVFKSFLPASYMRNIVMGCKFPNAFTQKKWEDFVKEVQGEYGIDGFYVFEPLKLYNPKDDFATAPATKIEPVSETSSKY